VSDAVYLDLWVANDTEGGSVYTLSIQEPASISSFNTHPEDSYAYLYVDYLPSIHDQYKSEPPRFVITYIDEFVEGSTDDVLTVNVSVMNTGGAGTVELRLYDDNSTLLSSIRTSVAANATATATINFTVKSAKLAYFRIDAVNLLTNNVDDSKTFIVSVLEHLRGFTTQLIFTRPKLANTTLYAYVKVNATFFYYAYMQNLTILNYGFVDQLELYLIARIEEMNATYNIRRIVWNPALDSYEVADAVIEYNNTFYYYKNGTCQMLDTTIIDIIPASCPYVPEWFNFTTLLVRTYYKNGMHYYSVEFYTKSSHYAYNYNITAMLQYLGISSAVVARTSIYYNIYLNDPTAVSISADRFINVMKSYSVGVASYRGATLLTVNSSLNLIIPWANMSYTQLPGYRDYSNATFNARLATVSADVDQNKLNPPDWYNLPAWLDYISYIFDKTINAVVAFASATLSALLKIVISPTLWSFFAWIVVLLHIVIFIYNPTLVYELDLWLYEALLKVVHTLYDIILKLAQAAAAVIEAINPL